MKKMERLAVAAIAAAVTLCVVVTGCDGSGSSGGGASIDAAASVTVQSYTAGTVIKNKVVNVGSASDVYWEVFTFNADSTTSGSYALYKTSVDEANKQSVSPIGSTALPTEFTYEKETAKFCGTAGSGATAVTYVSYLFENKKDGVVQYWISPEVLESDEGVEPTTLFAKWTSSDGHSYTFVNDGSAKIDDFVGYVFENDAGEIWVDGTIPFVWTTINSVKTLFYKTFTTEREISRSLDSNEVQFTSNRFMFLNNAE